MAATRAAMAMPGFQGVTGARQLAQESAQGRPLVIQVMVPAVNNKEQLREFIWKAVQDQAELLFPNG
jgi:hypothetical protein